MLYEASYRVTLNILGKSVIVEVKSGHYGPTTYTILGRNVAIFLFRKIEGNWEQVYGNPFKEEVYNATVKELERLGEES